MNKEKLESAINAMLDGEDERDYHDELVTLLSLVANASNESIASAWAEVHFDRDTEGRTPDEK